MLTARVLSVAFSAIAISAAVPTFASDSPWTGVEAGIFYPSNGPLRDALGDQWISLGLSSVKAVKQDRFKLTTDWHVIGQDKNGNKVLLVTPSFGVIFPFGKYTGSTQPYLAVRAGITYMDYSITNANDDRFSAKRFGYNGNVELGVNVGGRLNVALRYDVHSEFDDFSFNGLSITLKYGILKF